MLAELVTQHLGWGGGIALAALLPLLAVLLALLLPIVLPAGKVPPGFSEGAWDALRLLTTAPQAPWSVALMAGRRAAWMIGGPLAVAATLGFAFVGHAGRLELTRGSEALRQSNQQQQDRIRDLEGELRLARSERDAQRAQSEEQRTRLASCERLAGQQMTASGSQIAALTNQLATAQQRVTELSIQNSRLQQDGDLFNAHLREINTWIAQSCTAPTTQPPQRPIQLPPDPGLVTPPAPPGPPRPGPRPLPR
jgi:TolA-binding protein